MPSVGMRRSTRVFVPKSLVKDADGARILRSGKRLGSESGEGKPGRGNGDEWFRLPDNSGGAVDVPCYKSNAWNKAVPGQEVGVTDFEGKMVSPESVNNMPGADDNSEKMCGIVYCRKRQRLPGNRFLSSSKSENRDFADRMYGIPFVRKQRRNRDAEPSITEFSSGEIISEVNRECQELSENPASKVGVVRQDAMLNVVVKSSCSSARWFTCFLVSVLSFMRRSRIRLSELAAFMCSEPISRVFSQSGILFLPDLSFRISWKDDIISSGICKISGDRQFIPLFSLDFSAAPISFMSLHYTILLRSLYLPDVLVRYLMGLLEKAHGVIDSKRRLSCMHTEIGLSGRKFMGSGSSSVKRREVDFDIGLSGKSASTRHRANFRNVRKKRSSLRSVGVKNPSSMDLLSVISHSNGNSLLKVNHADEKMHGSVGADLFGIGDCCTSFSTTGPNHKKRKTVRKSPCNNIKALKPSLVELGQNMDLVCCSANILVIESDKCYREEGAKVMLECLASKGWFLAVKMQGLTRYMHKSQEVMGPSKSNNFTHAMIWTGENGWKLEFNDRQDWLNFKELHRECFDRNVRAASAKTIPVPGVHEVPGYGDSECVPFVRPDAYITTHDNDVARALATKTANYDLDSGDEEWLEKLNNDIHNGDNSALKHFSMEKFEEMIDVFEKVAYCSPDDVSDENRATSLCPDLGKDIIAAVYQYWLKKRKQKRLTLLKVFQCPLPRRAQLMQKPILRKKRSFKRQASQSRRGKQRSFLQAFAVEQEQDALCRVQEAKSSAGRSLELAILKRKRAQILMENADMATYKATMTLKIADAARLTVSLDTYVSSILG